MNKKLTKLTQKLFNELTENIRIRYNYSKYWDKKLIQAFFDDYRLTKKERKEICKKLEI